MARSSSQIQQELVSRMSNFMRQQTFRAVVWRRIRRSLTFCAGQPAIAACCSGLEPSAALPVKLIKSGAGTSAAQGRGSARELPLESTATLRHQIVGFARIRIFPLEKNSNGTGHFLWTHTHVVLTPDFMLHSTNSSQRVCLSATIEIRRATWLRRTRPVEPSSTTAVERSSTFASGVVKAKCDRRHQATAHGSPHLHPGDGESSRAGRSEPTIHHSPPAIAEFGRFRL